MDRVDLPELAGRLPDANGDFTYHVAGRLVDAATGQPLRGSRVYVSPSGQEFDTRTWVVQNSAPTDRQGSFCANSSLPKTYTQTYFLSIIPVRYSGQCPDPAPPGAPLAVRPVRRRVANRHAALRESCQQKAAPAERWIELGTVPLRPDKMEPVTFR